MSSTDKHQATFSWGAGAQSVNIAGNFNNWSADATPLQKQADGSFTAQVPLPWGEKQAFKYVVDGEWKVREDEAKEWDAAGNMNNVYTAPPAPIPTSSPSEPSSAVAAAAPTPAPASAEKTAKPTEHDKPSSSPTTSTKELSTGPVPAAVPATKKNLDDTPAPTSQSQKTEPSTLIASSAPGSASGSAFVLGGPVFPTSPKSKSTTVPTDTTTAPASTTTTAPAAQPAELAANPVVPAPDATHDAHVKAGAKPLAEEPIPVQIEKVAKQANIGEAPQPATEEEQGIAERASDFAAGALAAIGAVVGNAAVAVENLTGVDIAHTGPLSVADAKAQGIDINTLEKTDAPTDAVAPVGTTPSASAVDALQEKVDELKLGTSKDTTGISDVPLPKTAEPTTSVAPSETLNQLNHGEPPKNTEHDIPAQHETVDNHQLVPQPVITTVSDVDPSKDRSKPSTTLEDTAGTKPISSNPGISAKKEKEIAERDPIRTAAGSDNPLSEPKVAPDAPTSNITPPKKEDQSKNIDKITPSAQPATTTTAPAPVAPSTPAKAAPATPAKDVSTPAPASAAVPASATSTPASTPAKSTHTKEKTTDSDIRKRKSSFFGKIKHAFSPKDKSK
ncbi:hypothetical protein I302_102365 [Kwoniella bestiolae CBS 10118]|uniref:AMP-activated protein kinase glycogen-binding domain-containing protein n=1 Tax=Kwoniella bestiolae CBS 10118 TaxID=1296100 RepID=A0AAJ8M7C9_9TREE